ncbi:hypothetical protein ACLOJK_006869, partial [Asimina triloba]
MAALKAMVVKNKEHGLQCSILPSTKLGGKFVSVATMKSDDMNRTVEIPVRS